jgi:hypothetical protein
MKISKCFTLPAVLLGLSLAGCSGGTTAPPSEESIKSMEKTTEDMSKMLPQNPTSPPAGGAPSGK